MKENGLGWLFLAGSGAVAVWYFFIRKAPAPLLRPQAPPIAPPAAFLSVSQVASRFDEVQELWRMGMLPTEDATSQIQRLIGALWDLEARGMADPDFASSEAAAMQAFIADITSLSAPRP